MQADKVQNGELLLAEKMRVHILAKELNVVSKVIMTKCKAEGLQVTNHMSTLTAGLEATIREWFSEGPHNTTIEVASRVDLKKVRKPRAKKTKVTGEKEASKPLKQAAVAAGGGDGQEGGATATAARPTEWTA